MSGGEQRGSGREGLDSVHVARVVRVPAELNLSILPHIIKQSPGLPANQERAGDAREPCQLKGTRLRPH